MANSVTLRPICSQKPPPPPPPVATALVARRSLLKHPFYLAWSDGTLPVPALKEYAHDYGAFIRTVGEGWAAVGETHIAGVEEGHAQVWENTFAAGLETTVDAPRTAEAAALVNEAHALFADPVTALGALYAFESQQPYTAQSKLAGLREHYRQLPACCGEYFRLHEDDFDEPRAARRPYERPALCRPGARRRRLRAFELGSARCSDGSARAAHGLNLLGVPIRCQ